MYQAAGFRVRVSGESVFMSDRVELGVDGVKLRLHPLEVRDCDVQQLRHVTDILDLFTQPPRD